MAALAGSEVDNALIELDGPEVPIMDGSAAPFMQLIERAGIVAQDAARRAIKVLQAGPGQRQRRVGGAAARSRLLDELRDRFRQSADPPAGHRAEFRARTPSSAELAPARTFGLLDDWPRLKAAGLARGGSLDNAVVISGDRVLNDGGLRFADEFVRHKLLDAFGDLYLAGGPIIGHFRGARSGHALTRRLLAALFADRDAWCETTIVEAAGIGAAALAGRRCASRSA